MRAHPAAVHLLTPLTYHNRVVKKVPNNQVCTQTSSPARPHDLRHQANQIKYKEATFILFSNPLQNTIPFTQPSPLVRPCPAPSNCSLHPQARVLGHHSPVQQHLPTYQTQVPHHTSRNHSIRVNRSTTPQNHQVSNRPIIPAEAEQELTMERRYEMLHMSRSSPLCKAT